MASGADEFTVSGIARTLLAASLFLSITRFHQFLPILATLQFPLLLSATAGLIMFAEMPKWRPSDLGKHWIPKCVAVVLIIAIGGVPVSIYPGRSVKYLYDSYLPTVVLATLAWGIARSPQGAKFIIRVFCSSAVMTCLLAFVKNRRDRDGRLGGAYTYDPNDLAMIATVAIPLLMWWGLDKKAKYRWAALLAIPFCMKVILMTSSRGAFLGIGAIAAGLLIVAFVGDRRAKLRTIGLYVGIATIVSFPFLPAKYKDRITSIGAADDYNMTSITGRKQVWKRGMGYMMDNPIFGVGLDNFRTAEGKLSAIGQERASRGAGMKWSAAHNSFLQVGAELGIIAGLAFIGVILAIPVALIKRYRTVPKQLQDTESARLIALLAISVLSFFVTAFFLSQAYGDVAYLLLALATAVLMQPRVTGMAHQQAPAAPRERGGGLVRKQAPVSPRRSRGGRAR